MWLCALSNIKVKLINLAPPPNGDELSSFRDAILERVARLEECESPNSVDWRPVLRRFPTPMFGGNAFKSHVSKVDDSQYSSSLLFPPPLGNDPKDLPMALSTHRSLPRDLFPNMVEVAARRES